MPVRRISFLPGLDFSISTATILVQSPHHSHLDYYNCLLSVSSIVNFLCHQIIFLKYCSHQFTPILKKKKSPWCPILSLQPHFSTAVSAWALVRLTVLNFQLCYSIAVWLLASYLTSLCLSFLICKIILIMIHYRVVKTEWVNRGRSYFKHLVSGSFTIVLFYCFQVVGALLLLWVLFIGLGDFCLWVSPDTLTWNTRLFCLHCSCPCIRPRSVPWN